MTLEQKLQAKYRFTELLQGSPNEAEKAALEAALYALDRDLKNYKTRIEQMQPKDK